MDAGEIALWIIEIAVVWVVLSALQIPLWRNEHPVLRTIVFVAKLLLVPVCALLVVAIETGPSYTHCDLLCALYAVLVGDLLASVIAYAVRRFRTSKHKSKPGNAHVSEGGGAREDRGAAAGTSVPKGKSVPGNARASEEAGAREDRGAAAGKNVPKGKSAFQRTFARVRLLSFVLCFAVVAYGVCNARHVLMKEHSYAAEGLAASHTFAFAADLHAGCAQSSDILEDFCDQVNEANPEFVILGGDVTDELTSYEDMRETYRILSSIQAPVYFIYGNHDRQPRGELVGGRTYSDEQLEEAIHDASITILADDYVRVASDLVLLGREDVSAQDARVPYAQLSNPYEGQGALLVADHQPYDDEQLREEISALQVSGHTHAGQLFPLQAIYRLLGLQAYGEFEYPNTTLWVSAGEAVWTYPLRTEEHCEWDLVTLHP